MPYSEPSHSPSLSFSPSTPTLHHPSLPPCHPPALYTTNLPLLASNCRPRYLSPLHRANPINLFCVSHYVRSLLQKKNCIRVLGTVSKEGLIAVNLDFEFVKATKRHLRVPKFSSFSWQHRLSGCVGESPPPVVFSSVCFFFSMRVPSSFFRALGFVISYMFFPPWTLVRRVPS